MWLPVYHPYQVHDVFFWLIFQGNEDMVRHTWARCTLPVHVALLGSAIANKMVPLMFPTLTQTPAQPQIQTQTQTQAQAQAQAQAQIQTQTQTLPLNP